MLKKIFTWWNGATLGALFTIAKTSKFVGEDDFGNKYYEAVTNKDSYDGRRRRYVIYKGYAEASKIPPDWHGWMHYTVDTLPSQEKYTPRPWQKPHRMNMTGTAQAYRPSGSILASGKRPAATGDYKPWQPR